MKTREDCEAACAARGYEYNWNYWYVVRVTPDGRLDFDEPIVWCRDRRGFAGLGASPAPSRAVHDPGDIDIEPSWDKIYKIIVG
jgi:hypothetical protein